RLELADAYLGSGAFARAAAMFRVLSSERPEDPRFLAGLARTELAMSGDAYKALVQAAPESSFHLALEALSAVDRGESAKAAELYRRAQAAEPPAPWLKTEQAGRRDAAADAGHPLAELFHRGDLENIVAQTEAAKTP